VFFFEGQVLHVWLTCAHHHWCVWYSMTSLEHMVN